MSLKRARPRLAASLTVLAAVTALIALAAMLPGGATASDWTPVPTLVGNTDQPQHTYVSNRFRYDTAQAFTTGSSSGGYTLSSVDLSFWQSGSTEPVYAVRIHEDNGGRPGATLATLRNPASLPDRQNRTLAPLPVLSRFDANAHIIVEPGTRYWIVLDVVDPAAAGVIFATRNGEDAGGAEGWTIANNSRFRDYTRSGLTGSWNNYSRKFFMKLNGSAIAPPTDVQTAPPFQSKTIIVHQGQTPSRGSDCIPWKLNGKVVGTCD